MNQSTGHVLSRGLFIEEVDYLEPSNFWLGPRQGHTFVKPDIKGEQKKCFVLKPPKNNTCVFELSSGRKIGSKRVEEVVTCLPYFVNSI